MSIKLMPAKAFFTSTWPAAMSGTGKSLSTFSASAAPGSRTTAAFMTLGTLNLRDARGAPSCATLVLTRAWYLRVRGVLLSRGRVDGVNSRRFVWRARCDSSPVGEHACNVQLLMASSGRRRCDERLVKDAVHAPVILQRMQSMEPKQSLQLLTRLALVSYRTLGAVGLVQRNEQ